MKHTAAFCASPGLFGIRNSRLAPVLSRGSTWLAPQSLRSCAAHTRVGRNRRRACIVAADKALALPEKLESLVDSFAAVPDAKLRYQQLLFFAKKLPPMDASLKTDANLVRGCTSVVHVSVKLDAEGLVNIEADSDAQLTKGLVALLVYGLAGCSIDEILAVDPAFIVASGLSVSLTPSRNNGFINMVTLVKQKLTELKDDAQSGSAAGGGRSAADDAEVDEFPGRPVYSSILRKMRALKPTEVELKDNSYMHAGHAEVEKLNSESHFAVRVVSEAFEGVPLVKRHQLIYSLLADEMLSLHALNIEARTPAEVSTSSRR
jgi:BolA-like protein 1